MKKYYDQIVSLIKEHRKYPGCEDILDDIVEDVYTHADVVLNSVTNESVIASYLSKIVSTSMITVPKRLGVTSRPKGMNTTVLMEELSESENMLEVDEFSADETNDFTDITDNNLDNEANLTYQETEYENIDELDLPEQDDSETRETTDTDIEEEDLQQEATEYIADEDNEDLLIEEEPELEIKDEPVIIEQNKDEIVQDRSEPEVDKTLVDKMINGIASDENSIMQEEDILEPTDTELEDDDLVDGSSDEVISLPEDEFGETEEISELDLNIDDSVVETIEKDPHEQVEFLSGDEGISELSDEVIESLETFESNETELSDEAVEPLENDETGTVDKFDSSSKMSGLSAYDAFVFTPQPEEYDLSEVLPKIDTLASKYSDLKVLEVFKLKYYEKISVSEIAKKLDMSDSDVLKVLNELMYLVKE